MMETVKELIKLMLTGILDITLMVELQILTKLFLKVLVLFQIMVKTLHQKVILQEFIT